MIDDYIELFRNTGTYKETCVQRNFFNSVYCQSERPGGGGGRTAIYGLYRYVPL